ncbi:MAG: hypothetical protein VXW25_07565, partial [Pseudomonadota bacterium]|nr:hypothetical protein [Pseudomonadota bacterium]
MKRLVRSLLLFAILFGAWLLMSGHYTPLLIALGVVSCALAAVLADQIGGTDEEGLPLHIMARLPAYLYACLPVGQFAFLSVCMFSSVAVCRSACMSARR